jgi:hypothetical protein
MAMTNNGGRNEWTQRAKQANGGVSFVPCCAVPCGGCLGITITARTSAGSGGHGRLGWHACRPRYWTGATQPRRPGTRHPRAHPQQGALRGTHAHTRAHAHARTRTHHPGHPVEVPMVPMVPRARVLSHLPLRLHPLAGAPRGALGTRRQVAQTAYPGP